jgi:hypothetical protein
MWLQQLAPGDRKKTPVIPGLFNKANPQPGDTIGKVAVCGFSNGCIGVDETLAFADSSQIDAVIAIDGIQGSWIDPVQKLMDLSMYKRFFNHGVHVMSHDAENDPAAPCMVVTHSSIIPGNSPSTTDTAYYILNKVMGKAAQLGFDTKCRYKCLDRLLRLDATPVPWFGPCSNPFKDKITGIPIAACEHAPTIWNMFNDGWYERESYGNFNVWGWGDVVDGVTTTRDRKCGGPCDHIFQGHAVFRVVLEEFLVNRWNATCGIAGFGAEPALVCAPGQGCEYGEGKEKQDFFEDIPDKEAGGGAVVTAPKCPVPPVGYILAPTATNPCFMEEVKSPGIIVPVTGSKVFTAENMFAFTSGVALGYLGYRYANKRLKG